MRGMPNARDCFFLILIFPEQDIIKDVDDEDVEGIFSLWLNEL